MTPARVIVAILWLLAAVGAVCAQTELRWIVDPARPAPADWPVFQGETVQLEPSFVAYGTTLPLTNVTAALYWQTNGMDTFWWTVPAEIVTGATPRVRATWSPTNDCGAARYSYFIALSAAGGLSYRAHGRLLMRAAPGATPSVLAAPTTLTDAMAAWSDSRYDPAGAAQAVSNALANGAARGATALQPSATNGWTVGTHAGLLTPAWASTGMVAHAGNIGTDQSWATVASNTATLWEVVHGVVPHTNSVMVSYFSLDSEPPESNADFPEIGDQWWWDNTNGYVSTSTYGWVLAPTEAGKWTVFAGSGFSHFSDNEESSPVGNALLFATTSWSISFEWPPATNTTTLATLPAASNIVDNAVSDHNTNTTAHAHILQAIAGATNALINTYLLGTNAWMSISNQTLTIWRETNGVPVALWSSAESEGGGGIDPAFINAIWLALAGKADRAWSQYAPDGSANPDPAYMTFLNAPATMHASGYRWATYGAYSVMAESGAVAYESGADGTVRWGLDLQTNYVGFVRSGSVIVAAKAGAIAVSGGGTTNGVAEIVYPYTSGDFPALWYTPALDVPFAVQTGVVWVDNEDGTATVTAPATTPKGFWYATTSVTYDVIFDVRPPARLTGGVFGATNALPVVYDSTITISSGGKNYRIPAQQVP